MTRRFAQKGILPTLLLAVTAVAMAAGEPTLDAKLDNQFRLYEVAKTKMLDTAAARGTMTRSELDNVLLPPPHMRLNERNISALRDRHRAAIQAAKAKAENDSVLDLNQIRQDPAKLEQFCAQMPKGGILHIHPTGSISEKGVKEMLAKRNPMIPPEFTAGVPGANGVPQTEPTKYNDLTTAQQLAVQGRTRLKSDVATFSEFESTFKPIRLVTGDGDNKDEGTYMMYKDIATRAMAQGVRYIEFCKWCDAKPDAVKELEQVAHRLEKETGIKARWTTSYYRFKKPAELRSDADELIALSKAYQSPYFVGVNVVGDETRGGALEHTQPLFATLAAEKKRGGLPGFHLTTHAGEMGDVRNVRDSLIMGVQRIGHGNKLQEDPVTLEYARRKGVPVEMNIISNQRLGVSKKGGPHPFTDFLRLGLKVSLSTDDDGVFETDMNKECRTAIGESDVTYAEMKRMAYNSIETSFADKKTKDELLAWLNTSFADFEKKWGGIRRRPAGGLRPATVAPAQN